MFIKYQFVFNLTNTIFTHGVRTKVPDCDLQENVFDLQFRYYLHFWTNTLGKCMKPFISPSMG